MSAASDYAPALLQPGTIVLVDDEPALLRAFARILGSRAERVETYLAAEAAVKRVALGGVDVVISDVCMPGMSGIELLRAIREHDSDLPVVLLTGRVTIGTKDDASCRQAFEHIVKPVSSEALHCAVDRAVRHHRAARMSRAHSVTDVFLSGTHKIF